jgi:hypothetical protein
MILVANLKTSRPFILSSASGFSNFLDPEPGYQRLSPPPPSPRARTEEAAVVDRLHHDRTGAVPEQHERRAVFPVEDLREHVAADDEGASRKPRHEHRVRLRDGVHESRAAGEEVVGSGTRHAERVGEER